MPCDARSDCQSWRKPGSYLENPDWRHPVVSHSETGGDAGWSRRRWHQLQQQCGIACYSSTRLRIERLGHDFARDSHRGQLSNNGNTVHVGNSQSGGIKQPHRTVFQYRGQRKRLRHLRILQSRGAGRYEVLAAILRAPKNCGQPVRAGCPIFRLQQDAERVNQIHIQRLRAGN